MCNQSAKCRQAECNQSAKCRASPSAKFRAKARSNACLIQSSNATNLQSAEPKLGTMMPKLKLGPCNAKVSSLKRDLWLFQPTTSISSGCARETIIAQSFCLLFLFFLLCLLFSGVSSLSVLFVVCFGGRGSRLSGL